MCAILKGLFKKSELHELNGISYHGKRCCVNKTCLYGRGRGCHPPCSWHPTTCSCVGGNHSAHSMLFAVPTIVGCGGSYLLFLVTVAVTLKRKTREQGLVQKLSRFLFLIQKKAARQGNRKCCLSWREFLQFRCWYTGEKRNADEWSC